MHNPSSVRERSNFILIAVILIRDVTDNFFEDILHTDQPVGLPVFVYHNDHLEFSKLHLAEQEVNGPRIRYKVDIAKQPRQLRDFLVAPRLRARKMHGIAQRQYADDVVDVLFVNRET